MKFILLLSMILISACSHMNQVEIIDAPKTIINDKKEAQQLLGKHLFSSDAVSLMWAVFGSAEVINDNGIYKINGEHIRVSDEYLLPDEGWVKVEGVITEIGKDFFILDGKVSRLYVNETKIPCEEEGNIIFSKQGHPAYWRYHLLCYKPDGTPDILDYVDLFTQQEN